MVYDKNETCSVMWRFLGEHSSIAKLLQFCNKFTQTLQVLWTICRKSRTCCVDLNHNNPRV